jgi:hypothetical protein
MSELAKLCGNRAHAPFARQEMDARTEVANESAATDRVESFDLGFLPATLTKQCKSLIESYHDVHGYACLPDLLWKARLGPFIEKHRELRQCLKKASTTRSAKKSHNGFVQIATTILSLEILASSFAGWGAIYPEAADAAGAILKRNGRGQHMPLMEFYLYPPKYISSAAIATLAPPPSKAELAGDKQPLSYANSMHPALDGGSPHRIISPV